MQKVSKERLTVFKPAKLPTVPEDLSNLDYLHNMLQHRENTLFITLGQKMMKAGKDGLFDTWMYDESDLVQAAARSYGERLVSERLVVRLCKQFAYLENWIFFAICD